MAVSTFAAITAEHTLRYHGSNLIAVGRNVTTLTIERNSDPQTSNFSSIGTGSTACDGVLGIHVDGNNLHIVYVEITVAKVNTKVYFHRVFNLSTDTWNAAATQITSITSELTLSTQNNIRDGLAAFSNGELVCVLPDTDGANMGNSTYQARWWTWTSGGGWVDEGAAWGANYNSSNLVNVSGVIVGGANIAHAYMHPSGQTIAHYSQFRQSDSTTDVPDGTTDNLLGTVSSSAPHVFACVYDSTTDTIIWGQARGDTNSAFFDFPDQLAPTVTRTAVTAALESGHSAEYPKGMVIDSTGTLHLLAGDITQGGTEAFYSSTSVSVGDPSAFENETLEIQYASTIGTGSVNATTRDTRTSGSTEYGAYLIYDPDNPAYKVAELEVVSGTASSTITTTLNAAIQAAQSKAATLDAAIQDSFTKAITLDAAVAERFSVSTTADAVVQATYQALATLDAAVLAELLRTVDLDAVIATHAEVVATLDAAIQRREVRLATLDAALQQVLSENVTLDAAVLAGFQILATLDAAIAEKLSRSTLLDAVLQGRISISTDLDAAVQAAFTHTLTLDARIEAAGSSTVSVTLDAAIQETLNVVASLDAAIATGESVTATLDAAVQAAQSVTTSLDAALRDSFSVSATLDGVLASGYSGYRWGGSPTALYTHLTGVGAA